MFQVVYFINVLCLGASSQCGCSTCCSCLDACVVASVVVIVVVVFFLLLLLLCRSFDAIVAVRQQQRRRQQQTKWIFIFSYCTKKCCLFLYFFLLCCLPERPRLHLIYSIPEEEFRGVECGWAAIADHAQKQRRILLVYEILFVCCALNLVLGVNIKMHVKMQTCYVGVIVGVEWDWVEDVRRKVAAYEAKACWLGGWMEMAIRNYDTFNYRSRMTCSTWLADSKNQASPRTPLLSPLLSMPHVRSFINSCQLLAALGSASWFVAFPTRCSARFTICTFLINVIAAVHTNTHMCIHTNMHRHKGTQIWMLIYALRAECISQLGPRDGIGLGFGLAWGPGYLCAWSCLHVSSVHLQQPRQHRPKNYLTPGSDNRRNRSRGWIGIW